MTREEAEIKAVEFLVDIGAQKTGPQIEAVANLIERTHGEALAGMGRSKDGFYRSFYTGDDDPRREVGAIKIVKALFDELPANDRVVVSTYLNTKF